MDNIDYNKFTTDELFDMLPSEISYKDDKPLEKIYYMKITRGKRVNIIYADMDDNYLANTWRGDDTLREVIIEMLNWLYEFKYKSHQERYYPEIAKRTKIFTNI